jgi:hypothetical protein
VELIGGSPAAGAAFGLFNATTLTGAFATLRLPALAVNLSWNTSQLYTSGVISVGSGVAGDYTVATRDRCPGQSICTY